MMASSLPWSARPVDAIGRRGELTLSFSSLEGRTTLEGVRRTSPWHFVPPVPLDDGRTLLTWLVNPSGGLVGGDQMTCRVDLADGAHVVVSSPSATRVYRTLSEPAMQKVSLRLGPNTTVEWMPDVTIPFAGSRFVQQVEATLAPGATLVLWDAMAAGRIARGERWAFAECNNSVSIVMPSGERLLDRALAKPAEWPTTWDLMGEWNYVASCYVVGDWIDDSVCRRLDTAIRSQRNTLPSGEVMSAVSRPAVSGVVVKAVAHSTPGLCALQEGVWTAVRETLWGRACPDLRRY